MRPFDRYPGIHSRMKKSVQNVSNFSVQKKIVLDRFSQCMLVDYILGVFIIKKNFLLLLSLCQNHTGLDFYYYYIKILGTNISSCYSS